jgi:hypothetical protein
VQFYPDAGEKIPKDLPPEKGPGVRTVYKNADTAHVLVTRRSITIILGVIQNSPIRRMSKREIKLET